MTFDKISYEKIREITDILEIKETKKRRMTIKEFSRWFRENPTREYKIISVMHISSQFSYSEREANEPVDERVLIRENDGEWHVPLFVEVEE